MDGVHVTEVSDSGNVPELLLKNLLDKDVFASDGEALIGAKQNRVLNSSLFVNAKTLVPRDVDDDIKLVEVHKSRELPNI